MKKDFTLPAECNRCKRIFDVVIESKYANVPIQGVFKERFGDEGIYCEECNDK
jgi:hypothetical protein